jgi:hypothetical protein
MTCSWSDMFELGDVIFGIIAAILVVRFLWRRR